MPAADQGVAQTATGSYWVFECVLPGVAENCGVALLDADRRRVGFRFRRDWHAWAPGEADVLAATEETLQRWAAELGPEELLRKLGETLSNTLRISEPRETLLGNFDSRLEQLYRQHVRPQVLPFTTHLPLYGLRAAAGGFGADTAAAECAWVEAPPGLRLGQDMFALRISGRSMQDAGIPDGSLCVFRRYQGGSRAGQIVLVKRVGALEDGGELTIKRYASEKEATPEGWQHKRITMQPESTGYREWDLREDERYETVGVFVRVIEGAE